MILEVEEVTNDSIFTVPELEHLLKSKAFVVASSSAVSLINTPT
jgi:hypothetical protein